MLAKIKFRGIKEGLEIKNLRIKVKIKGIKINLD